ncbi:hypothetical protein INR49_027434 [Caranx melampygus]|nr:hypothetical protein INR49_027434 [Caranx melampygus]
MVGPLRDLLLDKSHEAAQRVGVALFPLPLPPSPLSILLADSLLLLQAADALLLGRAHQLAQLDSLDMVEGCLAGFVQHNGVEDDVEQRNPGIFFRPVVTAVFIFSSPLVFPEAEVLIQVERQQHRRLLRRHFVTSGL